MFLIRIGIFTRIKGHLKYNFNKQDLSNLKKKLIFFKCFKLETGEILIIYNEILISRTVTNPGIFRYFKY